MVDARSAGPSDIDVVSPARANSSCEGIAPLLLLAPVVTSGSRPSAGAEEAGAVARGLGVSTALASTRRAPRDHCHDSGSGGVGGRRGCLPAGCTGGSSAAGVTSGSRPSPEDDAAAEDDSAAG